MSKKLDHIKFFKMLVCPDDVRNGVISFDKWCDKAVEDKPKHLEDRTYMLLEFYTVFKRLYKYTKANIEDDIIKNITCDFDKENCTISINIKYDKSIDPTQSINDAKEYFMAKDNKDYSIRSINRTNDDPNMLSITFHKKER